MRSNVFLKMKHITFSPWTITIKLLCLILQNTKNVLKLMFVNEKF